MGQDPDIHSTLGVRADKAPTDAREQTDLQAASKEAADYSQLMPQLHDPKKWPRVVGWIVLALIVLGSLGGGTYWFVNHKSPAKPKHMVSQQRSSGQKSTQTNASTQQYSSSNLNLSFSYPKGWTVNDNNGGKLSVTSPPMRLADAHGQQRTGQEILVIANQQSADLSAFAQGSATAVLSSQSFAFTNPTSTQQASAYVSFLQYATTTTKGGLDGIYVTGNFGYTYAQQIPESDITKINPLIYLTFAKCYDVKCTTTTSLTVSSGTWKSTDFSSPILAMFKSLQLQ